MNKPKKLSLREKTEPNEKPASNWKI